MNKHSKELQRYIVKWVLVVLLFINTLAIIYGTLKAMEVNSMLILGGELATLLGAFFAIHMTQKVSDDT